MSVFGLGIENNLEPKIVTLNQPITAIGLVTRTNMKSIFIDASRILKKYMNYKNEYGIPNQKMPWEYVSLSKSFNKDQTWDYFTGHVVTGVDNIPEVFISFEIPAGTYAIFPIRCRKKNILGLAIGKIKRYIYNSWIQKSKYEFAGYEFEYNDEEMSNENSNFIDLYVAIKEKNK